MRPVLPVRSVIPHPSLSRRTSGDHALRHDDTMDTMTAIQVCPRPF
jgi:hypothetical protein